MCKFKKSLLYACLLLGLTVTAWAAETPIFRFGWGVSPEDVEAVLDAPQHIQRSEIGIYADREWALEISRQYGGFYNEQYNYTEVVFGRSFDVTYNFFQGRLYTKVYEADLTGITLAEAQNLTQELETLMDAGIQDAHKKRKVLELPYWGQVTEEEALLWALRNNSSGLQAEDWPTAWVAGMRWYNVDTMATLECSWNDVKQSFKLQLYFFERGHFLNESMNTVNDALWEAKPPAARSTIFKDEALQWGMDIDDVTALNPGVKAMAAIIADHSYILNHPFASRFAVPTDIYYDFRGGLSSMSCLLLVANTGREDFEALERRLAAAVGLALDAEELVVRKRPAPDDTSARMPSFGYSQWGNADTVAGMGGNYYADKEYNEIILNFHERSNPANADLVKYFDERFEQLRATTEPTEAPQD